ncbi:MAG: hypothetical protein ACK59M_09790 [Pseudomonadota bacterium]|jgi:hypothetical protein|nr:hypothetical protein [Xanthomonadaceae bacterium]
MIPATYESWRRCIEVDCGLVLEPAFIAARLAELRDADHERTAQFVRCYGDAHRQRVIGWFEQAARGG